MVPSTQTLSRLKALSRLKVDSNAKAEMSAYPDTNPDVEEKSLKKEEKYLKLPG